MGEVAWAAASSTGSGSASQHHALDASQGHRDGCHGRKQQFEEFVGGKGCAILVTPEAVLEGVDSRCDAAPDALSIGRVRRGPAPEAMGLGDSDGEFLDSELRDVNI